MKGLDLKETHELSADGTCWVLKEQYAVPYRESLAAQLQSWLAGKPVHNDYAGECCPDFSCCQSDLLWPEDKRKQFVSADDETRYTMLMGALAGVVETTPVYVAGQVTDQKTIH